MSSDSSAVIVNAGADALMIQLGEGISLAANQRVMALRQRLLNSELAIIDMVPAYCSLMVYYDVRQHTEARLRARIWPLVKDLYRQQFDDTGTGRVHSIDVYYGEEVGPDLARVADYHDQSIEDVIKQHTQQRLRVYALGFAPGFAYMGILPSSLVVPRLQRPREKIIAGSVAVAEQQTAVYPLASPGGWNIIGRTAHPMYQPEKGIISHLEVGDEVQFNAISRQQFEAAGGSLEENDD